MAAPVPKNPGEVLLTLTQKSSATDDSLAIRKITLTKEKPTLRVGRSSRKAVDFYAAPNNAWFDNAVMSRDHANLLWDDQTQIIFIEDTLSTHGTTHNDFQLEPGHKRRLQVGDTLKFGAPISRDGQLFEPCTVQVAALHLGPPQLHRESRPAVFTVPDDSDIDDFSSDAEPDLYDNSDNDADDGGVDHNAQILKRDLITIPAGISPVSPVSIDLTGDFPVVSTSDSTLPLSSPPQSTGKNLSTPFAPAGRFHDTNAESPSTLPWQTLPSLRDIGLHDALADPQRAAARPVKLDRASGSRTTNAQRLRYLAERKEGWARHISKPERLDSDDDMAAQVGSPESAFALEQWKETTRQAEEQEAQEDITAMFDINMSHDDDLSSGSDFDFDAAVRIPAPLLPTNDAITQSLDSRVPIAAVSLQGPNFQQYNQKSAINDEITSKKVVREDPPITQRSSVEARTELVTLFERLAETRQAGDRAHNELKRKFAEVEDKSSEKQPTISDDGEPCSSTVRMSDIIASPVVRPAATKVPGIKSTTVRFATSAPVMHQPQKVTEAEAAAIVRDILPDAAAHVDLPRKRMRRVAEAVGYVALGGVAVMSALIATAPAL